MNRTDKLLIALFAAVVIIVYAVADITFDMTTDHSFFDYGVPVYVITLIAILYFCIKGYGVKKWQTYLSALVYSMLFWFVVLSILFKVRMLYHAAVEHTTQTELKISGIKKVFSKRSFTGTKVMVNLNGRNVEFETSRTNFFALQNYKAIKVLLGQAGKDYYITKIYFKPGQKSTARYEYLKFWWDRNWHIPAFVLGFILLVIILIKFEKPSGHIYRAEIKTTKPKSFWKLMALVMGILVGIGLLFYVGLIAYVYIRYGGCPHCKFW